MLAIIGIFVLSFFPLPVFGSDGILIRADITIPQKGGRRKCYDIVYIDRTLGNIPEINVHLARKVFGNQNVILGLSVTPLQTCKEFAKERDVEVDYLPASIHKHDILSNIEIVYYDRGIDTKGYTDLLTKHFRRDEEVIRNTTVNGACYRLYGNLPVKLMYFAPFFNGTGFFEVEHIERNSGKASTDLNLLQSFQSCTERC